ncbi:uncharacterized protein METZ01_LOCUS238321 [marine metagenome]|uniref:DUF721 domain-containing protein n=1 Tax=marine metagenome TaxID=408172 RepID=A0A382HF07_9ZZZZ
MESVLEKSGLASQISRNGVLDKWSLVVGNKVAEVTEAKAVQGSTLFVEVRSSIWLNELSFMKKTLLVKINQGLTEKARIDRIIFRLTEK